jgi:probable rRNA maturation factor
MSTRTVSCDCLHPELVWSEEEVEALFHFLDKRGDYTIPEGELEVLFVDATTSGELHERFFDDPDPTDVMTFPGSAEDDHAGDIAVCVEVADQAAQEQGWSFAEELTLYLVHGWLHLAGLDDRNAEGAALMRVAESELMDAVRQAKIMPGFHLENRA